MRRLRMIEATGWRMDQRLIARGDDYWVEDDRGERVYRVDDKALLIRGTFILRDSDGNELAKVQERGRRAKDAITVDYLDQTLATVTKVRAGLHHRFHVHLQDNTALDIEGNIAHYEYEIKRGDDVVATVSRQWFSDADSYGIQTRADDDEALLVAVTVALDELSH